MPEHLKIKYEVPRLEENLNYYVKQDPKDTYAVFKGVLNTHKLRYSIFLLGKLMLCLIGLYVPVLMAQFMEYLEEDSNIGDNEAWFTAVKVAISIIALKIFSHTFWETLCYYMVETGHKAHTSLKTVIFKKALRLSAATNKQYSSGQVLNLIERDCNKIWTFVWDMPRMFEIPFNLAVACFYIY